MESTMYPPHCLGSLEPLSQFQETIQTDPIQFFKTMKHQQWQPLGCITAKWSFEICARPHDDGKLWPNKNAVLFFIRAAFQWFLVGLWGGWEGGGGERPKAVNASMETIFQSRGINILGSCGVMVQQGDQKELEGVSGSRNRTKKHSTKH